MSFRLIDIFTRLSVFDLPKGSSNTFKTYKNIGLCFKRKHLIIYCYCVTEISARSTLKFHAYLDCLPRLLLFWYLPVQNLSGPGPE